MELTSLLKGAADGQEQRPSWMEVFRAPPIIFVTAYTARYAAQELLSYGADDVVSKPIEVRTLQLKIARCVASSIVDK